LIEMKMIEFCRMKCCSDRFCNGMQCGMKWVNSIELK